MSNLAIPAGFALPENAVFMENGQPVTTSLKIAEIFEKDHKNVLQAIRSLVADCPEEFNALNFQLVEYTDAKGEKRPMYLLTFGAFSLVTMGFTGKRALAFKLAYIEEFRRRGEEISRLNQLSASSFSILASRQEELERRLLALEQDREDERLAIAALVKGLDSRIRKIHRENTRKLLAALDPDAPKRQAQPAPEPVFDEECRVFAAFVEADKEFFDKPRTIKELAERGFEPAKDIHSFKVWLKKEGIPTAAERRSGVPQKYLCHPFPEHWLPHLQAPEMAGAGVDAQAWQ